MSKKETAKKATKATKAVKEKVIVGYKTVDPDMCSWYDGAYKWTVGKEHTVDLSPDNRDGQPCGVGLHFAPTESGAMNYVEGDDFIMLEVQANESDILGRDAGKFRAAKLKVNKILSKTTVYGKDWEKALDRVNSISSKVLLKPNKAATTQKLTALAKAHGHKLHVITNVYEAEYAMNSIGDNFDREDYRERTGDEVCVADPKSTATLDSYAVEETISGICRGYVAAHEGEGDEESAKTYGALVEFLELGCLPIGSTSTHLVVFAPDQDLEKVGTHNLY